MDFWDDLLPDVEILAGGSADVTFACDSCALSARACTFKMLHTLRIHQDADTPLHESGVLNCKAPLSWLHGGESDATLLV